jgi:glutaredoxin-related protein
MLVVPIFDAVARHFKFNDTMYRAVDLNFDYMKIFKKIEIKDLPLYLYMKNKSPEFENLIKKEYHGT